MSSKQAHKNEYKQLLERARQFTGRNDFDLFLALIEEKVEVLKEDLIGKTGERSELISGGIIELRSLQDDLGKIIHEKKQTGNGTYNT